jgi:hypothetical protein
MSRSDDELDALLGALGPPAGSAPITPPAQILALLAPPTPPSPPPHVGSRPRGSAWPSAPRSSPGSSPAS